MSKRLGAWKKNTKVITLDDGLEVEVRMLDVLAMLTAGVNNPLMATVSKLMGGDQQVLATAAKEDPEMLGNLAGMLRTVCLKAIIDPPLSENGHSPEESISVDEIGLEHKMTIFGELLGGAKLAEAKGFLQQPTSNVVSS